MIAVVLILVCTLYSTSPSLFQYFASVNTGIRTGLSLPLITLLMLGHHILCLHGSSIYSQSLQMAQNGSIQQEKWKYEIKTHKCFPDK